MNIQETRKFTSRDEVIESLKANRNLAGADMSDLDLTGIKLIGLSLKGADLHNSNLNEATLAGADMSEVDLSNAYLENARIAGASMRSANLRDTHMKATKIYGVSLNEADLTGADLSQSQLVGVDVKGADFTDVITTDAQAAINWEEANVQPTELPETLAMPPRWLPALGIAVLAIALFIGVRRRQRRSKT